MVMLLKKLQSKNMIKEIQKGMKIHNMICKSMLYRHPIRIKNAIIQLMSVKMVNISHWEMFKIAIQYSLKILCLQNKSAKTNK